MRSYRDPATGDELTRAEWISWRIQGVIRRWIFLIVFLAATATCWATGNDRVLTWWNLVASCLAIVIEFVVGLAMFGQTRRDAHVLREIRMISKHNEDILEILRRRDNAEDKLGGSRSSSDQGEARGESTGDSEPGNR